MNRTLVGVVVVFLVMGATAPPALAAEPPFDPEDVEIAALNGEDPDQVNAFAVDVDERIHIELDGLDEPDRPLMVEIGGDVVTHMEEADQELRPRTDSDVTTGQQTLRIVYEDRGDRTIVAETEVRVTDVDLDPEDDEGSGLGFDPDAVEIATVAGQAADRTPEIAVVHTEEISIGLDGVDATEIYAQVELDGTHIASTTEGEDSFRPRQGRDVSEGVQTLTLLREREGDRIVVAETQVEVTRVDLTADDPTGLSFEPSDVSLGSVNGQPPENPELALVYNERISIGLDGLDASAHALEIALDGETIGTVSESETSFRPRRDADVATGEQPLTVRKRVSGADDVVIAETAVTVTEVNLDRDADQHEPREIDPATVSLVSVNGEPADRRNDLEIRAGSTLSLELEGVAVPDRGFHVEIGGETVGILESAEGEINVRRHSNVTTGEQTLTVVWTSAGERTVLAETPVVVTAVDLDRGQSETPPEDVDLEIQSVNGQPADGVVVTKRDLRGETPVELEVDGLAATDLEPSIRYRGETVPPGAEGFEIEGDRLTLDHLPRVDDGAVETLELVQRTGPEEYHVYDSVRIEYRHETGGSAGGSADSGGSAGEAGDDGGILGGLSGLFGGDDAADAGGDNATEDDDGGLLSTLGELLGL